MSTYLIMFAITLFLAAMLLVNARVQEEENCFFDKNNSNALRGFWCLIVVLVHIPEMYQNRIQDMLGSFAYIGVTFFFMTSAYGLNLVYGTNKQNNSSFWKKRLPKLLVPCFGVNILSMLLCLLEKKELSAFMLLKVNDWVIWLLICYLFFWVDYKYLKTRMSWLVIVLVCGFSILIYVFKSYINGVTWCPEIIGFIWGILLYHKKDWFKQKISNKWKSKAILLSCITVFIGLCYLKFKTIYFWGDYLLKIVLGLLIIILMLTFNIKISVGNKVSRFLGKISFEVYLIHGIAFGYVNQFMPQSSSGAFILTCLLITVLLSWILNKVSGYAIKCIMKFIKLEHKQ